MHIVIMGCGRVGSALARRLSRMNHVVSVIDQDPLSFRRLGDDFGGTTVRGMGFDQDTLREAGIDQADAFAAVSSGDNSNIISARVARETFNVTRVVARIYDPKRAEVYERLGIPTVATVPWTVNRLTQELLGGAIDEVWRDPSGRVSMTMVIPGEGWVGQAVSAFEQETRGRVAVVTRFGSGQLPKPATIIQSGDILHVLATEEDAKLLASIALASPEGSQA